MTARHPHESQETARELLETARTVAVLGAFTEGGRPAYYVPAYLAEQGYRIFPVNPRFVGQEIFGQACVATLAELEEPVDIVDVFRRPDFLPQHTEDILAMTPLPRAVWLQTGIRHDVVAAQLREAGLTVVQDRCTLADHRRMGITRR